MRSGAEQKRYYADLHIHSRHSRATSPSCTPEGLGHWAQLKGVGVCGTGDCTHPGWMGELREKLRESPDAPGLYCLAPPFQAIADAGVPETCRMPVRFMVTGEISSIYKRDGRCRKVHSVVLLPSLDAAERLNVRLAAVGNIVSDGRPILGLDPRDLLELLLEADSRAALIPAHIWTPWFSILGAKSGFDSLEECFGDLSPHIFAVETGLSSDAPMNRRIRNLDNVTLVSNSDLHSPANLGRDANIFFGNPCYDTVLAGLRSADPKICGGTVDLFPEEGKYHLDGHRDCGVCLEPEESLALENICPVCGTEVTIGVLHRVVELERQQTSGQAPATGKHLPYRYIIPLPELLGQMLNVGPSSQKVQAAYAQVLARHGSELSLLLDCDAATLDTLGKLGDGIRDVREGRVIRKGGFDGEYGIIRAAMTCKKRADT